MTILVKWSIPMALSVLIDTCTGAGDLKACVESLTDKPVEVILTHGHCDHAGGSAPFEKVWLHPADWELVKHPDNFFGEACMNLPDDLDRWEKVITGLLEHLLRRYGAREVGVWRFSMEPALYEQYGVFSLEQYKAFFLRSFRAIRQVIPSAHISAFGLDTGIATLPDNWRLAELLQFCRENDCMPNDLSFQSFSVDYRRANLKTTEEILLDQQHDELEEPIPVSADPDISAHELAAVRKLMEENGAGGLPLTITVWNNTIWQRDLGNDTCFKSAWIVKNILGNRDAVAAATIGLADYSQRSIANPNIFHGGLGVMSYLGFPKAGYHALTLLSRLQGEVICSGKGYLVTKTADWVMLMLYHYCHYDMKTHLTRQLPQKEQRVYDRYYGFEKKGPRSVQIYLTQLPPGVYEAESYLINRSFGSSYDLWMSMGAPERFSLEQQEYLQRISQPGCQYEKYLVDETGRLLFSVLLEPHEVRLIKLKKRG